MVGHSPARGLGAISVIYSHQHSCMHNGGSGRRGIGGNSSILAPVLLRQDRSSPVSLSNSFSLATLLGTNVLGVCST